MRDTQILSTLQELGPTEGPPVRRPALVLDTCQMGVVLRTVLFVEVVVAVATVHQSNAWLEWIARVSLATGAALPATLFWLLSACALKHPLARCARAVQYSLAVVLGAIAGAYGCGVLAMAGLLVDTPWLASALSGALLSAVVVAALVMRAKGRLPADTSARLAELQSRIRPHFLFNTLNSAIALVRAEPAKVEALLEDLSDLFRQVLTDSADSVRLADEVALARRYLAIEQVRFGERLRVEWALDPQCDGAQLPPLLMQPLVENAVVHGVEPSPSGADVRISTQRRGSVVVIKVTNTVPAGQGVHGQGLAQRNVRERLELLHDLQGQFRCGLQDGLYQVRIEVPL